MLARRLPSPPAFLGLGCAPGRAPVAPWRMATLVNVEGRLVQPEQAFVPVLDRGFLYGDSVYEVVRTYAGRPFELKRHLDRMDRSAAASGSRRRSASGSRRSSRARCRRRATPNRTRASW